MTYVPRGMRASDYRNNPIGSEHKSTAQRKGAHDSPTLTPTEKHQKDGLMRQFMANPEGRYALDGIDAYRASTVWCPECDGRRLKMDDYPLCESCWDALER